MNIEKIFKDFESKYKEELITIIDDNFSYNGLYNLIDFIEEDINDNGAIDELIDCYISIYYYHLRLWAVDNYNYIEDALEEFGTSKDYHKDIQMGQYMFYREEIYNCIDEMIEHIRDNYKI